MVVAPLQIDHSAWQIDQPTIGGSADGIIIIIGKLAVGQVNGPGIGQWFFDGHTQ